MGATDGTLVLGVLKGDRAAFAELYGRRARLIRAVCYDTVRDVQVSADLTQEVFLRAYGNLGRLRDPDRFGPWLVGIARQVCREWQRKRVRERRAMDGFAANRKSEEQLSESPEQRLVDLRDQIAGMMGGECRSAGGLTETERLALHSYYLQERDVDEARSVLGLSRSGFYRVMASACERLRRFSKAQEVHP